VVLIRVLRSTPKTRRYLLPLIACAPVVFLLGAIQAAGEIRGAFDKAGPR
jgi:hypothetical protein